MIGRGARTSTDPLEPSGADSSAGVISTFLFTDVEGSTRLWEQHPGSMRTALERHDAILRAAIERGDGTVVKATGDGIMAVFRNPTGAVGAALAAQQALAQEQWPRQCPIRVRMGIHSGEADARAGDYFGPAVNRTARIMAAGHGGQVLVSGSTAGLLADRLPPGAALRDLGLHRLKDLGRPEQVFQLTHPDLDTEYPALATLDVRPNNLPTQTSAFVGRERELLAIRDRLDDPSIRLVTLTGPGGTGKTRLALRAAAEQIDRFDDGVYFVELVSANDADDVIALIGAAVGLADTRQREALDELRRLLESRRTLLVLDNFEQVAVAAPVLVEFLADCPQLKLLITSRQALRVSGEHLVPIPPMTMPDTARAAQSAAELGAFEAIQLFVERARAVRPDFRLTDDNAAAVGEICRRLDGLPLAIELATARLNLFSPEALRDRLGSRLKLLGGGARDLPARQQTLRATIEWSYQLLEPAEQRLLELVSIFAGAAVETVEAVASAVTHGDGIELDALDGLSSLLDKSLVRPADEGDPDAGTRVTMLETIREFAGERLNASPDYAAAAREAHAVEFARLAAGMARATGPAGDADDAADERLAPDLENLRIAWRHWTAREDPERLNDLRDVLWNIYETRGWYRACAEMIRDQLAALETVPAGPERWRDEVELRVSLARMLTLQLGYGAEAEDAYEQALAMFEGQREVPQLFPVLRSLASFHGFRGEFAKGIAYAEEIVRLADEQHDANMQVDGLFLIGSYTGFMGRLAEGLESVNAAIRAFETRGYRPRRLRLGIDTRISSLTTSAFFLWIQGYPDQAVVRADRAVAIAYELDHPYSLAYGLFHSGFVHYWRREPEIVLARAEAVRRVVNETDLPIWRALGTCLLGAAEIELRKVPEGLANISEGLALYKGLRTPPVFWPFVRYLQATAYANAGDRAAGEQMIEEALAIGGSDDMTSALFHIARGDLALLEPRPDRAAAVTAYERAFEVARRFDARLPMLRAAARLCSVAGPDELTARRTMLRRLYESFDEGLGTPDLVRAAELMS